MDFSVQDWKDQLKNSYRKLTHWLTLGPGDAVALSYGALTGCTLWPLLEYTFAAAQQGQPLPYSAFLALGAIAGSAGSNLLAGQIQAWYTAAAAGDTPTEADILHWLHENVPQQAGLRDVLDEILAGLDALPQAQAVLPQDQWATFAQQLRQELHTLGNLPRFQAYLAGSGVQVQGEGNVTAVDNSIAVGGDVHGSVTLNKYEHLDPNQTEPAALRAAYLHHILDKRNQLWLGGIDPRAAAEDNERNERLELSGGCPRPGLRPQTPSVGHPGTQCRQGDSDRLIRRYFWPNRTAVTGLQPRTSLSSYSRNLVYSRECALALCSGSAAA